MTINNPKPDELNRILEKAKRIAVVGLSDNPERTSYKVSKHMLEAGYEIIPVNPKADKIFGIESAKSLKDIKDHVDIVNVFRRSEYLLDAAKEAAEIKPDVFWAQLGLVNEAAYDYLQERGITVVMDRCIKVQHEQMKNS
ncbi:putative CoA-binding protein [Scopulibacillus daqui]|uniref:CoA-binding protein n=1 Tax=Scopulibacillus daqui TaxID=1469162 RepID=A0ABS2PZU0_9BACL|nr:CoA-binding protein [Scopulibacillus daqui]MBM7645569.1 putative CoA-binding protein [Scopulibacillus daqui]